MLNIELKIPPILLVILFGILMWLCSLFLPDFLIPTLAKYLVCIALVIIGCFFILAGIVSFRNVKTTVNPMKPDKSSSLVTTGIYQVTRNPMYLGFLLILIGWGVFLANIFSLVLPLFFVLCMNRFQIVSEERALEVIFGNGFLAYKNTVRRWL